MTTWRKELAKVTEEGILSCTLTEDEMDVEFDRRGGGSAGKPFTAWSATRVFFPVIYDGREWVGSAPRNPCDEALEHQGSE